ncbi:hypothetical protein [Botrimarina colliarenosi]|nr:hypothetical protein [Botrimarina colliarenosi]
MALPAATAMLAWNSSERAGAQPTPLRLPSLIQTTPADAPARSEPLPLPRPMRLPLPVEMQPIGAPPLEVTEPLLPEPVEPLAPFPNETLSVTSVGFCEFCGETCGAGACCGDCDSAGRWGRFGRAVYRGLCCPDPCYDPQWRPLADAAFVTAAVRPQNQQRFRWDFAEDLQRPDRAEYFWARNDGSGKGPNVQPRSVDYDELRHYTEVAHGSFGAWFEYSYRSLDFGGLHEAGFGDMTVGTKTLLFDTQLVQVAFQFQTHIPQGSPGKGLGVGHTSLEPGLIFGLNLSNDSYVQAEFNEWIPLGGDSIYQGAIFRYNVAYNRVLARPHPCVPLLGVIEMNGWRFQDGAYTDPLTTPNFNQASGESYLHGAAGLRLFFCDRADFGVSYSTPITSDGWAETQVRSELRFRY